MVLQGEVAVFISCSETYKADVAEKFRDALRDVRLRGLIVSNEPLPPGTGWDPESKLEYYMNGSDALIALCTPDDESVDGTIHTRQNIIDEIQRARNKPHLVNRVLVLKSPSVSLPSNINPTYENLDILQLEPSIKASIKQLDGWGITPAGEALTPATPQAPGPSIEDDVAPLMDGLELGDHEEAEARIFSWLHTRSEDGARQLAQALGAYILAYGSNDNGPLLIVGSLLEALNRLDPTVVTLDLMEELAQQPDFSKRSSAAVMLWDRAAVAPGDVPLGLLARLARPDEDWYVNAPAMAAVKLLMIARRETRAILDEIASSPNRDHRYAVALALFDLARIEPSAVPPDLATRLRNDDDESVRQQAWEVEKLLAPLAEFAYERRFRPFGL